MIEHRLGICLFLIGMLAEEFNNEGIFITSSIYEISKYWNFMFQGDLLGVGGSRIQYIK